MSIGLLARVSGTCGAGSRAPSTVNVFNGLITMVIIAAMGTTAAHAVRAATAWLDATSPALLPATADAASRLVATSP